MEASCKFTLLFLKLHNSEIRIPVENKVSIIAASNKVRLWRYAVCAREFSVYIAWRNASTVYKGIVLGSNRGSRNLVLILLKGFVSMMALYSR